MSKQELSSRNRLHVNEKGNVHKYMALFHIIGDAIPTEEYSMLDIMRACEFIIADCIAQSNVSKEVEEKTYAFIAEDIKNFATTFKQQYQTIETHPHATKE